MLRATQSGCGPIQAATVVITSARSLSVSKSTRKKVASWARKASCCARSSPLPAQERRVLAKRPGTPDLRTRRLVSVSEVRTVWSATSAPGSKCEELNVSKTSPLCPTIRTSTRRAATSLMGQERSTTTTTRAPRVASCEFAGAWRKELGPDERGRHDFHCALQGIRAAHAAIATSQIAPGYPLLGNAPRSGRAADGLLQITHITDPDHVFR